MMNSPQFKKTLALALPLMFGYAQGATMNEIISTTEERSQLSITIYNESLALINETRTINLNAGLNSIAFKDVSAQIRPETALISAIKGAPFSLIEQNFDYDLLSPDAMLNKAVGQEIEVISTNAATGVETREKATVLSNNGGIVLKYADRIETGLNGRFAFTTIPANLRDRPTLSVRLQAADKGERAAKLSYLSHGFGWRADYVATLADDEKSLDLSGWITLNNHSGTSFNNAKVQLVAGDVHQVAEIAPRVQMMKASMAMDSAGAAPMPQEEAFADYHLYTLPTNTDLNNQQTKQVALLSTQNVPTQKEYRFTFHNRYQNNPEENIKAKIYYHLDNKAADKLGMPLPKGTFRMYKNNSDGNALFIGEDRINHIANNEKFALLMGDAFDVSLIRKQDDRNKMNSLMSKSSMRYDANYTVEFNNAKDEAVSVNYIERFNDKESWEVVNSSIEVAKTDARTATWTLTIPAKSKTSLTFGIKVQ